MKIVTISTANFFPITRRLLLSLQKSGTKFDLTIYCDDADVFSSLRKFDHCDIQELSEIRQLGVKRAKFTAYRRALADLGDFVYLDSDIIALENLKDLSALGRFGACPDDLSACSFVEDKRHPWPGNPSLANEVYVNSGILHVPLVLADFFEHMRVLSLSDAHWERHIFPGMLYDNHFLCAHLNLENIPVLLFDEHRFNWQGFMQNGVLQVARKGNALINKHTAQPLALVHFAGIKDIDAFLCTLQVDIASLLCELSSEATGSPKHEFTKFQAALSAQFREPLPDDFVKQVYGQMRHELLHVSDAGWRRDYRADGSYLSDAASTLSLAYSKPNSDTLWSDLKCGGAYLTGDEYNYLERLLRHAKIETALETGAGETSILLRRNGVDALALEAHQGPWLDRALAAGCKAVHVPFLPAKGEFECEAIKIALQRISQKIDLVVIDSPIGTGARRRVLTQILKHVSAKFVLFHDACRDADNLFKYQLEHRLSLIDYFPSPRGIALFALEGSSQVSVPADPVDIVLRGATCAISIMTYPAREAVDADFLVTVELRNLASQIFLSQGNNPVHISYHWLDENSSAVIWDGVRTTLPFNLYPDHEVTLSMRVLAPPCAGAFKLQVAVVQEGVEWVSSTNEATAMRSIAIE